MKCRPDDDQNYGETARNEDENSKAARVDEEMAIAISCKTVKPGVND